MAEQLFKEYGTIPFPGHNYFSLTGTGASAPTITQGAGVTITRNSAGNYTLTWGENPGQFHSWDASLRATTQANLAGFTVVAGVFNTSTFALTFVLYNTSQTATDLAANQFIDLCVNFKTGIGNP